MMRTWLVVAVGALLGCGSGDSVSDPPVTRVLVGVIEAGGGIQGSVEGPTTGAVGEPLTFRVITWGPGCYRSAGAAVINQGLQMTVIPYDSVPPGVCTRDLRSIPRDVVVTFDRSGDAVLRVQGASLVGRNPAILTWPMQIRP